MGATFRGCVCGVCVGCVWTALVSGSRKRNEPSFRAASSAWNNAPRPTATTWLARDAHARRKERRVLLERRPPKMHLACKLTRLVQFIAYLQHFMGTHAATADLASFLRTW